MNIKEMIKASRFYCNVHRNIRLLCRDKELFAPDHENNLSIYDGGVLLALMHLTGANTKKMIKKYCKPSDIHKLMSEYGPESTKQNMASTIRSLNKLLKFGLVLTTHNNHKNRLSARRTFTLSWRGYLIVKERLLK
jgi:hypothetical protein